MKKSKEQRQQRIDLINQLATLEKENCRNCPNRASTNNKLPERICKGCPAFKEIRSIGKQLDNLSNGKRDIITPETLTMQTYKHLRDNEWTKHAIRIHYKLTVNEFTYFLEMHKEHGHAYEEPRKAHNVGHSKIAMTVEQYNNLRSNLITDKAIRERYGYSTETFLRWKRANGVPIQKQARGVKIK